jgi:hypothetical protein
MRAKYDRRCEVIACEGHDDEMSKFEVRAKLDVPGKACDRPFIPHASLEHEDPA